MAVFICFSKLFLLRWVFYARAFSGPGWCGCSPGALRGLTVGASPVVEHGLIVGAALPVRCAASSWWRLPLWSRGLPGTWVSIGLALGLRAGLGSCAAQA